MRVIGARRDVYQLVSWVEARRDGLHLHKASWARRVQQWMMEGSQVIGQARSPLERWMAVEGSQEATEREKRWGTLLILAQGD